MLSGIYICNNGGLRLVSFHISCSFTLYEIMRIALLATHEEGIIRVYYSVIACLDRRTDRHPEINSSRYPIHFVILIYECTYIPICCTVFWSEKIIVWNNLLKLLGIIKLQKQNLLWKLRKLWSGEFFHFPSHTSKLRVL